MKIAKTLRTIADILEEPVDSQEDESYRKKQSIFYQVVLEKQFSLRFTINTTLISISIAFLALLPTITDHLFHNGIPCTLKPLFIGSLVCFISLVILCVVMYELDSTQLKRLDEANNGKICDIDTIPSITAKLLTLQYLLLIIGVILTSIIFYNGVFYV